MKEAHKLALALACSVVLAGCGGGGGGSGGAAPTGGGGGGGGTTSTNTFNAQAAYKARITNGATDNFTVSGNCVGTAMIAAQAAKSATFNGISGVSVDQTTTATFSNCFPGNLSASVTYYFDANGTPIGSAVVTNPQTYARLTTANTQAALPSSVKVGDSGTIGNYTLFSDSTFTTVTGSRAVTWTIEADTATTAIIAITIKDSNTGGTVVGTEEDRFRVDANGALTAVSVKIIQGVLNITLTKS